MKENETQGPRKTYTYSGKAKCLQEYQKLYTDVQNEDKKEGSISDSKEELYRFFIEIAPIAYHLYERWKTHEGFKGSGIRAIERDQSGEITRVPDGILFPILASLSAFMVQTKDGWRYQAPKSFDDQDIIKAALSQYKDTAQHNPTTMGKTQSIYSSLYQITSIFKRLDQS